MKYKLNPYTPPPPPPAPEREACERCKGFQPETLVPAEVVGRSGPPIKVCWGCAHDLCEHDASMIITSSDVGKPPCGCPRETIFPHRAFSPRETRESEPDLSPLEEEVKLAKLKLQRAERALTRAASSARGAR